MRRKFYWLFLLFIALPSLAVANREICGTPPPEQFREENNESIKGDLAGKANFLSGFVGKAELGGKIEATRKEIFAKYSDANAAYMDRYLAYMFCFVLFDPKNQQNSNDKIKAIQEFKRQQQSQSSIEKGYASSNAAERAEAIRAAFEAVSVFGVALEADWSLVDERDKKRYTTELPRCEQVISRPINFYSRETGKFSEMKDFYGSFQGQVSGQSIRFGGIGYGGVSYSGNLVNTGNDWKFTGLVTCGSYKYKAVFQLR